MCDPSWLKSINKPGIDVPVLELAAEEIRRWPTLTEEVKKDLIMAEEKTVYSQVFVFSFLCSSPYGYFQLNFCSHSRMQDRESQSPTNT